MQVDVWSDVVCPWCYLGTTRLYKAIEESGLEVNVTHHAFELDPSRPRGVVESQLDHLVTKYRATPEEIRANWANLAQLGADEGISYQFEGGLVGNSNDAHRVVRLGLERGIQSQVLARLFRAHFGEGRSIFDHESLVDLGAEAGLDRDEVAAVLAADTYAAEVAQDEAMARSLGISGVPFYVLDQKYGVSGAQPRETLRAALQQAAQE